jgi:hypothetical protein
MNEERNRPGPLILDANATENWRKFIREFEIYLVAKEKDRESEKLKVNLLLNFAGSQAIEEYSHFVYGEGESAECYKDVCHKFKEWFGGANNVIYERLVFNRRNQQEGERIDHFVSGLKRLEATVIPFKLYKELTKKPMQKIHQPLKGWLAVKAINLKGCVRLPTQYKGKEINFPFLGVDGNFTPLLSCDACLDLEILKFMNLKLISGEVCEKESFDGNLEGTPKACGLETVKSDPVLKDV